MNKVVRFVLRPIARFCLGRSLKLQDLVEAFKEILVQEAQSELVESGRDPSGSRISVMTGVHRKDVNRILNRDEKPSPENLVTKVLGQWRQSRRFSVKGRPRILSHEGSDSEFADLVRSVSADLNPYTVLFELNRLGLVRETARGLKLESQLMLVRGDEAEAYRIAGDDLHDLLNAVHENVAQPSDPPNLHIRTYYDNIPAEYGPRLRKWLMREGSLFHDRIGKYLAKFDRDTSPGVKGADRTVKISVTSVGLVRDLNEENEEVRE